MKYFYKNIPNWNKIELLEELKKFEQIYKERPIKNNIHGMLFPHMFATYYILKKINPSFVIESGVFKGQSTWLIEKILPNSKILSIDIDLKQREYISNNVEYSNVDFKNQDFSNIPDDTLVFFDDHVDHYERLKQAKFFNIKNIILEDNYKEGKGDFYTIKHSYQNVGFNHNYTILSNIKTFYIFLIEIVKKILIKNYFVKNLEKIIDIYYEFPPLLKKCDNSTKPILENNETNFEISKKELLNYNYITFIKLL